MIESFLIRSVTSQICAENAWRRKSDVILEVMEIDLKQRVDKLSEMTLKAIILEEYNSVGLSNKRKELVRHILEKSIFSLLEEEEEHLFQGFLIPVC